MGGRFFSESLGSIALIMGFLTRLCSLGLVCIMIGAIATFHRSHGFFANWSGKHGGEGFEYHLLVLGICIPFNNIWKWKIFSR